MKTRDSNNNEQIEVLGKNAAMKLLLEKSADEQRSQEMRPLRKWYPFADFSQGEMESHLLLRGMQEPGQEVDPWR